MCKQVLRALKEVRRGNEGVETGSCSSGDGAEPDNA
jgi:hypothetical protein